MIGMLNSGKNRLLAALPRAGRQGLLACCEQVELRSTEVMCRTGDRVRHAYFPTEGAISLVTMLDDGSSLEVCGVGQEGMLGSSLIMGRATSMDHAIVQQAGVAWRLSTLSFQQQLRANADLRKRMNCYVSVLMGQLALMAACAHHHPAEARFVRWLLMARDRACSNQFHTTQEFAATMLGVRRAGITEAATSLRNRGLIDYRRGVITILDEHGLERMSCGCYQGGNAIYERALG